MTTVVLVFHVIIVAALIGLILLQKSEGGALGIGGGSGSGSGFMSTRGTANLLTRATAVLAGLCFATTLTLAMLFKGQSQTKSLLDQTVAQEEAQITNTPSDTQDVTPDANHMDETAQDIEASQGDKTTMPEASDASNGVTKKDQDTQKNFPKS